MTMKNHTIGQAVRAILVPLGLAVAMVAVVLMPDSALAVQPPATPAREPCPLTAPQMTAALERTEFTTRAGQPVDVVITVPEGTLPPGFYLTNIVTPLGWPDGTPAKVLSGVPVTTITPPAPGGYTFRMLVNLVAKSTCAGAKATTLLERTVTVQAE